jgi:hypothetical protein
MKKDFHGLFVGIDPGKGGAVSFITYEGELIGCYMTPTHKFPKDKPKFKGYDVYEMARLIRRHGNPRAVTIENVHALPLDGKSSAFTFGYGVGLWHGICGALNVPVIEVTPNMWIKHYGLVSKRKDSECIRNAAMKRWDLPIEFKYEYDMADATFICEWGREQMANADRVGMAEYTEMNKEGI